MKTFRIKVICIVAIVSSLAVLAMKLYLGIFVERYRANFLGTNPGLTAVMIIVLEAAAAIALYFMLMPLEETVRAIDEGRSPPVEEREAAQAAAKRVPALIVALVVLGFALSPLMIMGLDALKGSMSYSALKAFLIILVNASFGFMTAIQIVIISDGILRSPIARLAFHELPKGVQPVSFRVRFILAGAASATLACVLFAVAGWSVLEAAARGEATSPVTFLAQAGVLGLVILGLSLVLFVTIGSTLARRASDVAERISEIAAGEGDLTKRATVTRNDELSSIAAAFNLFLDRLVGTLGRVRELTGSLHEGSGALGSSFEHAREALGALDQSLGSVREAVERQSDAVGATEGEISRMLESINQVAARVSDQAGYVEQSSAAVSEMAANIAAVSRTAVKADELSSSLREASEEGGKALKDSVGSIAEIEASSKAVRAIISVISKIAAQTNLLAMNAAIEAAHAGDAGRGFAVVADEVRGLAESSAKSAKEIEGLIRGMAAKIDRGGELADRAGKSFDRIREGVAQTGELVQTIAASMSEQQLGAQEILRSVASLTEATRGIKDLTIEQKAESKVMEEAMLRIVGASNDIFEAVQEETGSSQSLGRVMLVVDEEAGRNRDRVKGLEEAVSRFKTGAKT